MEGLTKFHTVFDENMDEASLYVNTQLREQLEGTWVVSLGPKGTSLCLDCKTLAFLQLSFRKKNKEYDAVIAKIEESKVQGGPTRGRHDKKRLSMCLLQVK